MRTYLDVGALPSQGPEAGAKVVGAGGGGAGAGAVNLERVGRSHWTRPAAGTGSATRQSGGKKIRNSYLLLTLQTHRQESCNRYYKLHFPRIVQILRIPNYSVGGGIFVHFWGGICVQLKGAVHLGGKYSYTWALQRRDGGRATMRLPFF